MTDRRRIREVEFRGTHFERGLQRGLRLKDTLVIPDASALPDWFIERCRAAAQELYPPALEEFEGLVRGGGFERDPLAAYYFARLESRLGGCTMFAVAPACRDAGRGPIVGRNYDWAVSDLSWCELHRYYPDQGLRRIGYTHHWAGCPDALNERGLYLAIASLPPEPVRRPGVQWSILAEMVSESCTSVAQAVDVCARAVHLRPMSYLLADASGDAAVVEATPRRVSVRRPEEGLIVAANAARGGEVLAMPVQGGDTRVLPEPVGPPRGPDDGQADSRSARRIQRALELLREQSPGISDAHIRRILADHEAPICTGDHEDADGAPWGTIWSGICAPAEGTFAIAPGLPCRHDCQTFTLDA
ncbi:MAG: C45 family autoproteolytic acyltransferase/hydrolase [Planctomycetota bacterium]